MSRSHAHQSSGPPPVGPGRAHARAPRAPLCAAAALTLLLAACAPSRTAPPPEQPGFATAFDQPELAPGARVTVERGGQWLPATVVGRVAPDRVMIRYEGYGPEWDEAVGFDRIRSTPGAAADYRPGEKVLVTAQGRLLLADIVQQTAADEWRVHYDGYGAEVSENVKPDRLRRPYTGATAHATGEVTAVDVGGRTMPARVLAALAADRWLVRFDGFGPEYDQEVTADRFRQGASADLVAPAQPAPPGPAAPSPAEASGSSRFKAGEDVFVAHRGAYHAAVVVGPGAPGKLRVRYTTSAVGNEGSFSGSDEDVAADRVSAIIPPEKGARYQLNQNVFVEWHGLFFPGRVSKTMPNSQYRIRFENFGPEADEIIPARRLRPRP